MSNAKLEVTPFKMETAEAVVAMADNELHELLRNASKYFGRNGGGHGMVYLLDVIDLIKRRKYKQATDILLYNLSTCDLIENARTARKEIKKMAKA